MRGTVHLYQEDEGVVHSIVLSTADIVALVRRAFPEAVAEYKAGFDRYYADEQRQATQHHGGFLKLVEKEVPQDATGGA